jgi:hypothetical protein
MKEMYKQVSARLNRVDFSALWPGFDRRPFALYDDQTVCVGERAFPRDDRFLGNTAIMLDGAWTAVWNVVGGEDPDILAAGIVHEMFHCFQSARGESRFPDDLELFRLGVDGAELGLRALECAILAKETPSLSRLADARARRRAAYPALTRQAELAETAEGMAEFMGMTALAALAPEKGEHLRAAHRARLANAAGLIDAALLADTRRIAYFTGALLLDAARAAGYGVFHQLGHEARTLGEVILSQIEPEDAGNPPDAALAARAETRRAAEKCRALGEGAARTDLHAFLTGYDPMNMTRAGDFVACDRFVMLNGELLDGPVLLEMAAGSKNEVLAVYRRPHVVS